MYQSSTYNFSNTFLKGSDCQNLFFNENRHTDYYPFGMLMPNRHGQDEDYRYGFNGMEKDDEIRNTKGASYDFGARMYDSRIGRWLSGDALEAKYPSTSTYAFVMNSPLAFIDPDGNDYKYTVKYIRDSEGTIIKKEVSITVIVKVVNLSEKPTPINTINRANKKVKGVFDYSSTVDVINGGKKSEVPVEVTVNVSFQEVENTKNIKAGENVMFLVDGVIPNKQDKGAIGKAELDGNISIVEILEDQNTVPVETVMTALHEIGHGIGLEHSKGGLMNETGHNGYNVSNRHKNEDLMFKYLGNKDATGISEQKGVYAFEGNFLNFLKENAVVYAGNNTDSKVKDRKRVSGESYVKTTKAYNKPKPNSGKTAGARGGRDY